MESGISEIPIHRLNDGGFLVQKGMRVGRGGDRVEPCELDNAAIDPSDIPIVGNVD